MVILSVAEWAHAYLAVCVGLAFAQYDSREPKSVFI